MFSISYDKFIILLIVIGTIVSLLKMYEGFADSHPEKMSFPNSTLYGKEKYLNSLHISSGWRNAYLSGGGNPLFRETPRLRHQEVPIQTKKCNYPIKDEKSKKHPFFN
jgi:hypothetical protein